MPKSSIKPVCCSVLFFLSGTKEYQGLDPDRSMQAARDERGRFAPGRSGNPRGRPPGIPNPRRRVPDVIARPLSAQALSDLIDRKPYLLRPLARQLLPPPVAADPAERLGLDLAALRTPGDIWHACIVVLNAAAHGAIAPAEALRIARRVRRRVRAACGRR